MCRKVFTHFKIERIQRAIFNFMILNLCLVMYIIHMVFAKKFKHKQQSMSQKVSATFCYSSLLHLINRTIAVQLHGHSLFLARITSAWYKLIFLSCVYFIDQDEETQEWYVRKYVSYIHLSSDTIHTRVSVIFSAFLQKLGFPLSPQDSTYMYTLLCYCSFMLNTTSERLLKSLMQNMLQKTTLHVCPKIFFGWITALASSNQNTYLATIWK